MPVSREINKNISLTYIPMEKLKTTTIGFYIHRPLSKEEATKNALLENVMKQGSKKYPTLSDLSKALDNLYGARFSAGVSKKGEDHIISFEAEAVSDKYIPSGEKVLKELTCLLCEIIFNPLVINDEFDKEILSGEKKNLLDKIKSSINDKRVYASEKIVKITCEDTPYSVSRLGDEEFVEPIDGKTLFEHYKEIIKSSKIDVYVAGQADIDSVCDAVLKYVEDMEFIDAKIPKTEILDKKDNPKSVREKMEVTQGKLAMSFTTGIKPTDEKFWALLVANSVFGQGAHSKLFNNVREKMSLAYYVGSQMHKYKGFIAVNAGVEVCNFKKAYDEILVQLKEVKEGNITDKELTASKMFLINNLKSYYDDQFYMQGFYLGEKVAGTFYDIEYYIKKIENVKKDEVVEASQNIFFDSVYYLTNKDEM